LAFLALHLPGASTGSTELHARMPENGGWSENTLYAEVGQPLHLRLTSDDVLHSFAIGQSNAAPIELRPGEWTETTLVFDRPGRYTYYCTRWCGRNHWRMRGTIVVTAPAAGDASSTTTGNAAAGVTKPLYLRLGLDPDAPHEAEQVPASAPSVQDGAALAARLPAWSLERQTYLESSPAAVWQRLRGEGSLKDLSNKQLWDAVAYLWSQQTTPEKQVEAAQLYATNCAACHGETGKGDGVMVEGLPRYQAGQTHTSPQMDQPVPTGDMSAMDGAQGNMRLSAPPDFTDPHLLLGASPALLEGKMLRGGMGTGMPYWGPIFTQDQMDAVIAYLYNFAMKR
jgi:mono/diheme cytochrome c family protein